MVGNGEEERETIRPEFDHSIRVRNWQDRGKVWSGGVNQMGYVLSIPWVFGLGIVSGVGGAVGTFIFFVILRRITGATVRVRSKEFFYAGFVTGVIERIFFTCLVGLFGPNGIAPAAIGWIAIKGQVHYKMFSEEDNLDLPRVYLGLLGSMASLLFAIIGGYLWYSGWSPKGFW